MTETKKCLVLDANILVRALFGRKVRGLLESHSDTTEFYCPDICFPEASKYIPSISARQGRDPGEGFKLLDALAEIIEPVDHSFYKKYEATSRRRMAARDMKDWPVVATALLLNCPIWTEDQDFFGCGVATWTTQNIEVFLGGS
jgi:predicted nucleic acid-binding protein